MDNEIMTSDTVTNEEIVQEIKCAKITADLHYSSETEEEDDSSDYSEYTMNPVLKH